MTRFNVKLNEDGAFRPIELEDSYNGRLTDLMIDDAEQLRDVLTVIIDEAKARLEANDGTHR